MSLGTILRNVKDRGLQDITNPAVIKAYINWLEIKKNGINVDAENILSFAEQIVWRTKVCEPCVKAGECVHCHCEMPQKALIPLATCSANNWGIMLSAEDWQTKKQEEGIELILITK